MSKKLIYVLDNGKIHIVHFPPGKNIEDGKRRIEQVQPQRLAMRSVIVDFSQIPDVPIEAIRYEFNVAEFKIDYSDMPIDWAGFMLAMLGLSAELKTELGTLYVQLKECIYESNREYAIRCWEEIDASPITPQTKLIIKDMMNACYFEIP